jgi:trehalose 6-phosphate phosphatase
MKSILSPSGQRVLRTFARGQVLLAFDFDGTLAPIVSTPDEAVMRPRTAALFSAVAHRYPCIIVTGRAARDVRRRVHRAPIIAIVGNHGAEHAHDRKEVRGLIARALRRLKPLVARLPGMWIENKTYSLSVHYRDSPDSAPAVALLWSAVSEMRSIEIVPGKRVLNIVASGAPDKGVAVERIRRSLKCTRVIYVGDDETDEHVFRHISPAPLLGIRVGVRRGSRAGYALPRQERIDTLLEELAELRGSDADKPLSGKGRGIQSMGGTLEFMRMLWALDHALNKRSKQMARAFKITGEQRLALRVSAHAPEVSAGDLALLLHVHPSTLTGILRRLAQRGLLERRTDRHDRRRLQLLLTDAGRRAIRSTATTIEGPIQSVLRHTSARDRVAATSLIERLIHALELPAPGRSSR